MSLWARLVFLSVIALTKGASLTADLHNGRCEPITIPICREIPYNTTIFPNLMGHSSQDEASSEMYQYFPLIKVNCSADIHLFLCSMYAPVCTILERALPPCRSLCKSARQCETLMEKFGFEWPPSFECNKFPEAGGLDELCVGQHSDSFRNTDSWKDRTTTIVPSRPDEFSEMMDFICPAALKVPKDLEYKLVRLICVKINYLHILISILLYNTNSATIQYLNT